MSDYLLVLYRQYGKSHTQNEANIRKKGWKCDMFKVHKQADDILRPPFDVRQYDFICAGSGLRAHLPYNEVLNMLRGFRTGMDPRITLRFRDETIPYISEPIPEIPPQRDPKHDHHKMILGPDSPKLIVFITYAGYEYGPKEAEPAVQLLALEMEHVGFQFIGKYCCPGKYLDDPTPRTFHGDIRDRPNEKDLLRAEHLIEEKPEEIADRSA